MQVLVDTTIWVDYFRSGEQSGPLETLIDKNLLLINELILAELIPFLEVKGQLQVIDLLMAVERLPLNIDWPELIRFQAHCLKQGVNGIGIPDLIIAQNALHHDCPVYSLDRHFRLMHQVLDLPLFQPQ